MLVINHSTMLYLSKTLPNLGQLIRKSSGQLKFYPEVEEAVNKQIRGEQQAAQDYLSIAMLFLQQSISRSGSGIYFMKMYHEELDHMQQFIQYQLMRGGTLIIKGIREPKRFEKITILSAFQQALEIEDNVTQLLENLVKIADCVKDYQCADFVTSVFLREQRLTLNELTHHITKLSRLGNDEHALYHYDLQLANMHTIHKLQPSLKEHSNKIE